MASAEATITFIPQDSGAELHPASYRFGQAHPWYAVRVRSNFEKTTSRYLESKGYEVFAPHYRMRRKRKDRSVVLDVPLFSGYVFCRFDHQKRLPILKTPGLVRIVGFGNVPLEVSEEEIASIAQLTKSGLLVQPWPYMQSGDVVRISDGALAGLEGILVETKGRHRLVLSVTLLQRSVSTEVDANCVEFIRRGGEPSPN